MPTGRAISDLFTPVLKKLPMEEQSVFVRELEAAIQSRIAVWNIFYTAATPGRLYRD